MTTGYFSMIILCNTKETSMGAVHRVNLVIYQKSSKTTAYSIGLCDLSKRQTSASSTTSCTESKKTAERSQVIYKTKLTTHAEDLAGFLIFKIETNLITKYNIQIY